MDATRKAVVAVALAEYRRSKIASNPVPGFQWRELSGGHRELRELSGGHRELRELSGGHREMSGGHRLLSGGHKVLCRGCSLHLLLVHL
ncbi:unnamed protein product [Boreogadus saida]